MTGRNILIKLVWAQNLKNAVRTLVGLLGVAIAVCLVVWIIRGYEIVITQSHAAQTKQGGRFDALLAPQQRESPQIDAQLLAQITQDPAIAEVDAAVRTRARVVRPQAAVQPGPFGGCMLVGTASKESPYELIAGTWLTPAAEDTAVINATFQERMKLKLGDELVLAGNGGEMALRVAGVFQMAMGGSSMMSPMGGDVYVTMPAAEKINGFAGRPNTVSFVLKDQGQIDAFVKKWEAPARAATPPASLRSLRKAAEDPMGDRMVGMIKMQAGNAIILAFMAAAFIIFTVLSSGIRERQRQYAILRAVALSRTQLVMMIALEAMAFSFAGWVIGITIAKLFLTLGNSLAAHVSAFNTVVFQHYPLGKASLWASALCVLAGALTAAIIPTWQAVRLKPIDILSAREPSIAGKFPWLLVAIGLFLVVINPVIILLAEYEPIRNLLAHTYTKGFKPPLAGCTAMIVGMVLTTPIFIKLADDLFGPAIAWLFRIDRRFLRQQLTSNLWRIIGTTISLSLGLTLFVTVQVWGYSMLVPFKPDASLPQMLVSILPAGVPESAIDEVRQTEGVQPDQCLAMAVEQPKLTEAMLQSKPFAGGDESQQHVLVLGVDPATAIGGGHPIIGLRFVQGDRATAARQLAEGSYCLVPDHFHTQTGLGVGDKFSVEVPNVRGQTVEYTIAGVVSVPGWHWFTKMSEIRRRSGRALAIVFADYSQTRQNYALDRISYFWLNTRIPVPFKEMEARLQPIADRYAHVRVNIPQSGETLVTKQYVKITDRDDLTARLLKRANDVIWSITQFPLMALIIASLAVFNAVVASIRARYWQIGVLRSVGMTRGQLFRMIVSESCLVFLTAGALSLATGISLAWCGTHLCTYFFYFGGLTPPLVLPLGHLAAGFGLAFGLSLLAGILPAAAAAAKEPLYFIQAGRNMM